MPHLFTNRPRKHNLLSTEPAGYKHFNWESVNSSLYLLGGFIFIIGSIFFIPKYSQYADNGAWMFFGGSLIYLIVTIHDLLEAFHYRKTKKTLTFWDKLEIVAAFVYLTGTLLFVIGSLFFLSSIHLVKLGSWAFIIGSILFLFGAIANVVQIILAGSLFTLQLMNATAICFSLGSMIFLLASVPYLWPDYSNTLHVMLFTYVAREYILGSIFFLLGGIFNFYRSYLAMTHYRRNKSIDLKMSNE